MEENLEEKENNNNESEVNRLRKFIKLLVIPAIAIVVFLVMFLLEDRPQEVSTPSPANETIVIVDDEESENESENESEEEPATEAEGMTNAPDNSLYINNFEDYGLQKDAILEINELLAKYQRAKITGDAALLYEVFGKEEDEAFTTVQTNLEAEKEVYEAYNDTVCYSVKGPEEGEYLVFVSSWIQFKGIETPAPMLIWTYVVTGDDGNLYMKEPDRITPEEHEYLELISSSEDVKLLDLQMKSDLAAALTKDEKLAELYNIWTNSEAN